MSNLKYSDVIPENLQSLLTGYNASLTEMFFEIGDISNMIYSSLIINKVDVTHQFICAAVGFYSGKSSRTIRFYSSIASYYSKEVRERYNNLSFSHFSYAKQFVNWEEVLEYSSSNNASVDNVIAHFTFLSAPTEILISSEISQDIRDYTRDKEGLFVKEDELEEYHITKQNLDVSEGLIGPRLYYIINNTVKLLVDVLNEANNKTPSKTVKRALDLSQEVLELLKGALIIN